jgi:hypothetical protein
MRINLQIANQNIQIRIVLKVSIHYFVASRPNKMSETPFCRADFIKFYYHKHETYNTLTI